MPHVIQLNIHQHSLGYSIIFSVVSEQRSKTFQGNIGNSTNVQKQAQVQDSDSLALGLRYRGPLQPVFTQITAGPCLWGLRFLVKAVRRVAMPPPPPHQIRSSKSMSTSIPYYCCKQGLPCQGIRDTQDRDSSLFKLQLWCQF